MKLTPTTFDRVYEFVNIRTENPLFDDPSKPAREGMVSDVPFGHVRAAYPLIHATHSDRLTKNFTYYSKKTVVGMDSDNPSETTGYRSFVKPTGVPILKEHRSQDFFSEADVPMGRTIYAGYKAWKKSEMKSIPVSKRKGYEKAGNVEGSGALILVPAITEPDAVEKVLGGQLHTVSIGSHVGKVIESISGIDIAELARSGRYDDMPEYRRGQIYKVNGQDQLSFWYMEDMHGIECSYVNVPADDIAMNKVADIGVEGVQKLLLGEKKPGAKEFALFDAKTGKKLEGWQPDEGCYDESFSFVDSLEVGKDTWWAQARERLDNATATESVSTEAVETITNAIREVRSTMDMKNQIRECLKAPETFIGVKEKLEGQPLETFMSEVTAVVQEKLTANGMAQVVKILAEGGKPKGEFSDETLLQNCQATATETIGDWNEEAAGLALVMFGESGGSFVSDEEKASAEEKLDKPVTYGELYALDKAHALYGKESEITHRALAALSDESFAGENRTFPVTNLESAVLACRFAEGLSEEKQTTLGKMARVFGALFGSEGIALYGAEICATDGDYNASTILVEVKDSAQVESTLENIETISEGFGLGEEQTKGLKGFLEAAKSAAAIAFGEKLEDLPLVKYSEASVKPVRLGTQYLFERFKGTETAGGESPYALQLLAVCRTRNISKEEIEKSIEGYKHFHPRVVEKLLDKLPAKKAEETTNQKSDDVTALESVTNPAAEVKTTVEDKKAGEKKEKDTQSTSWMKEAKKPLRNRR